jgi:hypothetical protein
MMIHCMRALNYVNYDAESWQTRELASSARNVGIIQGEETLPDPAADVVVVQDNRCI